MTVYFDNGSLDIPEEALEECYHPGECYGSCLKWKGSIDWDNQNMTQEGIKAELAEYGAWDTEALEDREENRIRILWIAAGKYQEERV